MRMVTIAQRNCGRLVHMVNELLQSQALDSGNASLKIEPLQIRLYVEEVVASLQDYAKGFSVSVRLDDDAEHSVVLADSGRSSGSSQTSCPTPSSSRQAATRWSWE